MRRLLKGVVRCGLVGGQVALLMLLVSVSIGLWSGFAYCLRCAYPSDPDDYSRYGPGTVQYEARQVWYDLPDVVRGKPWRADWSVFNPFAEADP